MMPAFPSRLSPSLAHPLAADPQPGLRVGLPRARRAGFTLVEILMAIAISTLILGASAIFMYSAFSLLEQAQNDPGLEHQKMGVTSFLEYSFTNALPDSAIPISPNQTASTTAGGAAGAAGSAGTSAGAAGTAGTSAAAAGTGASSLSSSLGGGNTTTSRAGTTMAPTVNGIASAAATAAGTSPAASTSTSTSSGGNSTAGNTTDGASQDIAAANNNASVIQKTTNVAWGWPPSVDVGEDPELTWVMPTDSPLIVWDNGPHVPIRCFLQFKDHEGLELVWVPPSIPNDIEINSVRVTLLSALVVKMTYVYFDANALTWDTSDSPPKDPTTGSYVLPDYVQLTFDLNGKLSTMSVAIPPSDTSLPLY